MPSRMRTDAALREPLAPGYLQLTLSAEDTAMTTQSDLLAIVLERVPFAAGAVDRDGRAAPC